MKPQENNKNWGWGVGLAGGRWNIKNMPRSPAG